MSNFQLSLIDTANSVEIALNEMLKKQGNGLMAAPVHHAVLNGGKRLRAFLTIHSSNIFGVHKETARKAAMAIECQHAYSLVHDDLPCMDNDDLRRGKPTVHIKWDEATATLTGDALQALAFELIASLQNVDADKIVELSKRLAKASGMQGMVLGQAQDIDAETSTKILSLEKITALQQNKTGALIEWASTSGAILAGQDDKKLLNYARLIGLAFQIQDDYLDAFGDPKDFGKQVGGDILENKKTILYHEVMKIGNTKEKEALFHWYDTIEKNNQKVIAVKNIFKSSGASIASQKLVTSYTEDAFKKLESLIISAQGKELLIEFGQNLMNRKF